MAPRQKSASGSPFSAAWRKRSNAREVGLDAAFALATSDAEIKERVDRAEFDCALKPFGGAPFRKFGDSFFVDSNGVAAFEQLTVGD